MFKTRNKKGQKKKEREFSVCDIYEPKTKSHIHLYYTPK